MQTTMHRWEVIYNILNILLWENMCIFAYKKVRKNLHHSILYKYMKIWIQDFLAYDNVGHTIKEPSIQTMLYIMRKYNFTYLSASSPYQEPIKPWTLVTNCCLFSSHFQVLKSQLLESVINPLPTWAIQTLESELIFFHTAVGAGETKGNTLRWSRTLQRSVSKQALLQVQATHNVLHSKQDDVCTVLSSVRTVKNPPTIKQN